MNISVVIPTYNRPELLKRAIDSVRAQTHQDFEVLIIDDGEVSPENIISEYNDDRLKYYKNEKNIGGAASRNRGVSLSQYELIAFLDDDDEWFPEKLERQISILKQNPKAGFCFSAVCNVFDSYKERTEVPEGLKDFHERALTRFKGVLTPSLLIRKEIFNRAGGFDESFPSHQEAELLIRVSEISLGIGINDPLVYVHIQEGRDHVGGNIQRRIDGRKMILKKHEEKYKKRPRLFALQWYRFFFLYREAGENKKAKEVLLKSLIYEKDPKVFFRLVYFSVTGR